MKVFVMTQASLWNRNQSQILLAALTALTAVNVGALVYHYYNK